MSQEEGRRVDSEAEEEREPSFGGAAVSSKYRCVLRLDSGGMAEVFLAVAQGPVGFNKLFVLKRLREALAENPEHRDMFLHEARLAARLNHPNVVQTYEVGEDGTGIFIAMEYLEGQPLSRVRREIAKKGIQVSHAVHARIVSEVLSGLHYAHEVADYDGTPLKIVHRDVSPQNVFLTYDGQVKIVDFGIAKTHDSGTQAGVFKGKFAYTAPEQLRGEAVDRRADIFTSGIVLWEMLTGEKLLAADSPVHTIARLLNDPIPSVASIVPDIDPRLDAIVMRALERNPAKRFPNAQAMRDELEEWLVAAGHSVRPDQLAKLLGELFRNERARVQQAIKEEIATWAHSPSTSRVVAAPRLPNMDESVSLRGLGTNRALRSMGSVSAVSRDEAPELEALPPSGRSTFGARRLGMAALVLGLAGAIGYIALSRRGPSSPSGATAPATTPTTPTTVDSPTGPLAPTVTTAAPGAATGAMAGPSSGTPEETAAQKLAGGAPKWVPHAKKPPAPGPVAASTSAPPSVATSTITNTPTPAPTTDASGQKEKRKFRLDL